MLDFFISQSSVAYLFTMCYYSSTFFKGLLPRDWQSRANRQMPFDELLDKCRSDGWPTSQMPVEWMPFKRMPFQMDVLPQQVHIKSYLRRMISLSDKIFVEIMALKLSICSNKMSKFIESKIVHTLSDIGASGEGVKVER